MKLKVSAVFMSLLIVFSFGCKKKKKGLSEEEQLLTDTITYQDTIMPFEQEFVIEDTSYAQPQPTDSVLAVDTATNTIKPIADEQVVSNQGKIYIIVGSFKKYENALKAKAYYSRLGYSAQILPKVAGFNRVAVAEFTDLSEARAKLNELRRKFNRPDFWLLYKPSDF